MEKLVDQQERRTPVDTSEGKDVKITGLTSQEIVLNENLRLEMEIDNKVGVISSLRLERGNLAKFDILADYPDVEVKIEKGMDFGESFFVVENGKKRVVVGDLSADGSRLVLLHELEHSLRSDLVEQKNSLREKFYQAVIEGEDGNNEASSVDVDTVRVSVWLPTVEDGRLTVKKFVRQVSKKLVVDYVKSWVRSEKESWQAALAKYKRLKQEGFDLEPNLSPRDIEGIARQSLEHYQDLLDSMKIGDQICLPQFWEKESEDKEKLKLLRAEIIFLLQRNKDKQEKAILAKLADFKAEVLQEGKLDGLEIEAQFGIAEFLLKQKIFNQRRKFDREMVKDLTEYQYLITFYVDKNKNRKELAELWDYFYKVNSSLENEKRVTTALQYGIIGQVALLKIFRKLGRDFQLATPTQDAYQKTDAWVERGARTALQVKRFKDFSEPVILPVDEVSFPALVDKLPTANVRRIYSVADELRSFAIKKRELAQTSGISEKELEAFMVVLPGKGIDNITGHPSDRLVKFFADYFGNKGRISFDS